MTASKTKRLLYFMSELEKGNDISKTDYLARFGISERTLKEDVSELKENLTELRPNMKVKYSRKYGSYHAQYEQGYGNLKYNQAVILSKILLESRALRKDEVAEIINIFVLDWAWKPNHFQIYEWFGNDPHGNNGFQRTDNHK